MQHLGSIVSTPAGPQASAIHWLWNIALVVASIVYVITMGALVAAMRRSSWKSGADAAAHLLPTADAHSMRWVGGCTVATIVVLFAFLVADLVTSRRLSAFERPRARTIRVTGMQWWWRVDYLDTIPQHRLSTANEIYVPTGIPVQLELRTADVIHSFWVPALHGKRDLLPNHRNMLWIQADTAGVYRGQCAEFCGHQHANMAIVVVALSPDDYQRWYARHLLPVDTLALSPAQHAGQQVFERKACVMCHAIRGTVAAGSVAPELTHVASRWKLASGAVPNTTDGMRRWIDHPQLLKPGTRMPDVPLTRDELEALVAYLRGLP